MIYQTQSLPPSGHMVMGDCFNTSLFQQTFQRVFSKDVKNEFKMGFSANVEIKVGICKAGVLSIQHSLGSCVTHIDLMLHNMVCPMS